MTHSGRRRLVIVVGAVGMAAGGMAGLTALPVTVRVAFVLVAASAPGVLVAEWLLGVRYGRSDADRLEKFLYGLGIGLALLMTTALVVSFLPGGVAGWQILAPIHGMLAVAATALWRQRTSCAEEGSSPAGTWPSRRAFWLGLLLVLAVGMALRVPDLGYSEFQGDEARVLLRASEVIEGYENALFAHQKMPGEILLMTATYAVTRQMDEAAARLPFTAAGLAALAAIFLLGSRLFGPSTAVSAGVLAALTGYFVAFARIVQYQSLVFLAVVLTILVLWRMLEQRIALWRYLAVAALLMAAGVLGHYEAVGIGAAVLYILWRLWRSGTEPAPLLRTLPIPLLLFLGPVLLFVVPFARDPTFATAYAYAVGYRVDAGGFPYNNLADFFARASLYGTAYSLFLLITLTAAALATIYARNLPRPWAWFAAAAAGAGLIALSLRPGWPTISNTDPTWSFFVLLLLAPWLLPRVAPAERLLWWWFGTLFVFSIFVVQRPNSHVYTFFIPWVLLGGMMAARAVAAARQRIGAAQGWAGAALAAAALIGLFGFYLYRLFVYSEVEILRTWPENRPAGYWMPFDSPPEVAIFGFPHSSGWKVIGLGYANNRWAGNFLTNEKPEVVDWYTRGAGTCPRGNQYYVVASRTEPQADAAAQALLDNVANEFSPRQIVTVKGQPKLHLFDQPGQYAVETVELETMEARFNAQLTDPHFVDRRGRVVNPLVPHRLNYRLGNEIELLGYALDRAQVAPGKAVHLTLYWRALRPMNATYTVFNQIIDLTTTAKAGQVDGMPVCDRNPTERWFAGDTIADPYTIAVAPDAAPGTYTLISGMYDSATGERLQIRSSEGTLLGTEAVLASVEVR